MVSIIVYGLLALVVAAIVVAVLVLVLPDDTVAPPVRDVVPGGLPDHERIEARDVHRLRLPVGLRGYRMTDTDAVLDRLSAELARRDEEISRLRRGADVDMTSDRSSTEVPGEESGTTGNPDSVELGETPEDSEDRMPKPVRTEAVAVSGGATAEVTSWDPASAQR